MDAEGQVPIWAMSRQGRLDEAVVRRVLRDGVLCRGHHKVVQLRFDALLPVRTGREVCDARGCHPQHRDVPFALEW